MRGYLDILDETARGLLDMVHEIIDTIAEARAVELADNSDTQTFTGFEEKAENLLQKIK